MITRKELQEYAKLRQLNLEARVINRSLFSRDIRLYGGVNDDQRYRFKEDFSFNLTSARIDSDGSVPINSDQYADSHGTEFIFIGETELTGTTDNYAISSRKYNTVKVALNAARESSQGFSVDELVKAGGFKVNEDLAVGEHIKLKDGKDILHLKNEEIDNLSLSDFEYIHSGWHSHFIGFNDPTTEQELEGAKLYVRYLQEVNKDNRFRNGKGMGFLVETGVRDYKASIWRVGRWHVGRSDWWSGSYGVYLLDKSGRYLKVLID